MTAKTTAALQTQRAAAYTETTPIPGPGNQLIIQASGLIVDQFRTFLNALKKIINQRTALEGTLIQDIIDSSDTQISVETSVDYIQTVNDDVIFSNADLTVTLLDPAVAIKQCKFRAISGTMTLVASTGTTETATLTIGQAQTMYPRATGWFNL